VHDSASLLHGESYDADGDEAILTIGRDESRITSNVEEEFPVLSGIRQLVFRRTTKWNAADNEGSSVKSEFLLAVLSFFADEADCLLVA
jgi:hypothetical protein